MWKRGSIFLSILRKAEILQQHEEGRKIRRPHKIRRVGTIVYQLVFLSHIENSNPFMYHYQRDRDMITIIQLSGNDTGRAKGDCLAEPVVS